MADDPRGKQERRGPGVRTLLAVGQATGGVTHDVDNALTAIVTRAALIRAATSEPGVREHAEAILRAARSAGGVVDRVRALLRPGDRQTLVRVEPEAVVREAVEIVRPRADQAGCALRGEAPACPDIPGVASELVHLLVNLGTNAVDAAGRGGHATIRARPEGPRQVRLEVLDDGPGIPDEVIERMFEPFVSGKSPRGGMGLGLALCRRIAELHGAELELARLPEGGTVASIVLPAADAEVPRPRRSTSLELAAVREPAKVLVVDDDHDAREALAALLNASGFEVHAADGVGAAWEVLEREEPTVVVTDLALAGGQSGWDLVRQLEARDALLPVLVTTGDVRAAEDPAAARVDGVLTKPVNPGTLVARVRDVVAKRRALKEAGS